LCHRRKNIAPGTINSQLWTIPDVAVLRRQQILDEFSSRNKVNKLIIQTDLSLESSIFRNRRALLDSLHRRLVRSFSVRELGVFRSILFHNCSDDIGIAGWTSRMGILPVAVNWDKHIARRFWEFRRVDKPLKGFETHRTFDKNLVTVHFVSSISQPIQKI
jgi:hypothetical protein